MKKPLQYYSISTGFTSQWLTVQHVRYEVRKALEHVGHEASETQQNVTHEVRKAREHVGHEACAARERVGHKAREPREQVGTRYVRHESM